MMVPTGALRRFVESPSFQRVSTIARRVLDTSFVLANCRLPPMPGQPGVQRAPFMREVRPVGKHVGSRPGLRVLNLDDSVPLARLGAGKLADSRKYFLDQFPHRA